MTTRRRVLSWGLGLGTAGLAGAMGRRLPPAGGALAAEPAGFREAAPGLFVHVGAVAEMTPANRGDIANVTLVVGEAAAAVIDSGGSPSAGEALLAAVRRATDRPLRYLVLTHMHPDHSFGAQAFQEAGAQVVAHRRLAPALAARADHYRRSMAAQIGEREAARWRPAEPDVAVADTLSLDLGGRSLDLRAWATAHTDNDLTAYDARTRTLVAGDLVFADHVPTLDGSIAGWLAQTPALADLPAAQVVPGHGAAPAPWPAALGPQTRYLETLAAEIRAAIRAGVPLEEAVRAPAAGLRGEWQLFDVYNARNATAAYAELEWE